MRRTLAKILIPLALFALISFGVILVNQTAQLVLLADRLHPLAGDITFWAILALFAFTLIVPLFLILTLPKPLVPPETRDSPEFELHVRKLGKRLTRNPHVSASPTSVEEIEAALVQLDSIADQKTKAAASQIFVTTAISQNGSLDALLVLAAQSKLILEIARLYYQRPTLRDLLYLYTNVGATALLAAELEDLDLSAQVQPVLTGVLGSTAGAVPGLAPAASLFVNSVTTGAGNAFLTLRVGIITKQYCRSLVEPERSELRRAAALQATRMLGNIARDGGARVAAAIFARPMKYLDKVKEKSTSAWKYMNTTTPADLFDVARAKNAADELDPGV